MTNPFRNETKKLFSLYTKDGTCHNQELSNELIKHIKPDYFLCHLNLHKLFNQYFWYVLPICLYERPNGRKVKCFGSSFQLKGEFTETEVQNILQSIGFNIKKQAKISFNKVIMHTK